MLRRWLKASEFVVTDKKVLHHVTTFLYDSAGNLASVTDANSHTTSFTYANGGLKNTANQLQTASLSRILARTATATAGAWAR
jgi:YD repeat-containing protein